MPAEWSCSFCTFLNPDTAPNCGMCGNEKQVVEVEPEIEEEDDLDKDFDLERVSYFVYDLWKAVLEKGGFP